MIIKTSKIYITIGTVVSISPILLTICMRWWDWEMFAIMFCSGMFFFTHLVLPGLRVIVMKESGCTISYLWWKKTYLWSDFEIVTKGTWSISQRYYHEIVSGMFFSVKAKKKDGRKRTGEDIYFSWRFLECFYVIFVPEKVKRLSFLYSYTVNEEEFIKKLNAWNVNIEELER